VKVRANDWTGVMPRRQKCEEGIMSGGVINVRGLMYERAQLSTQAAV